jgi:hypothetical protein
MIFTSNIMNTEVNGNCMFQAQILNLQSDVRELKELIKRRDDNLIDISKSVDNMCKYFKWLFIVEATLLVLSKL